VPQAEVGGELRWHFVAARALMSIRLRMSSVLLIRGTAPVI
jgi:hypothetical protein